MVTKVSATYSQALLQPFTEERRLELMLDGLGELPFHQRTSELAKLADTYITNRNFRTCCSGILTLLVGEKWFHVI